MRRRREPAVSAHRTILRLLGWLFAGLRYMIRAAWDAARGQATAHRRGQRMRRMFEELGGAALKLGQQLAVRVDLLPYETCEQLALLMDHAAPMPLAHALQRIEAAVGAPMDEVFSIFDPAPIGSASIACVYRARLVSGDDVAIKVQRPDIARRIAEDLRVLDWLTLLPEALSLAPAGQFKHLRSEMRKMLLAELDFEEEIRHQKLFRRFSTNGWLTAPKVHARLSSPDVIVSEFIEGMSCRELLAAAESGDDDVTRRLEALDISPKLVARRVMMAFYAGAFEGLFFHADPHPANIIVRPGNELVFLDFGSCGTVSRSWRLSYEALMDRLVANDVSGMAETALQMLAPLPLVDTYELRKRIEQLYQRFVLAVNDKDAEWWERTSVALWLAMLEATREANLPVNLEAIRMFRAAMLYDTIVFRLHRKFDIRKTYRRYQSQAAGRAVRQYRDAMSRVRRGELEAVAAKRASEVLSRAGFRAWQAETDVATAIESLSTLSKASFVARAAIRAMLRIAFVAIAGTAGTVVYRIARGAPLAQREFARALGDVVTSLSFIIIAAVILWISLRTSLARLGEIDPPARDGYR